MDMIILEVFKCDRCGAIYEDNAHRIQVLEKDLDDHLIGYWDLCDKCVKDFRAFMKKELKKNELGIR